MRATDSQNTQDHCSKNTNAHFYGTVKPFPSLALASFLLSLSLSLSLFKGRLPLPSSIALESQHVLSFKWQKISQCLPEALLLLLLYALCSERTQTWMTFHPCNHSWYLCSTGLLFLGHIINSLILGVSLYMCCLSCLSAPANIGLSLWPSGKKEREVISFYFIERSRPRSFWLLHLLVHPAIFALHASRVHCKM